MIVASPNPLLAGILRGVDRLSYRATIFCRAHNETVRAERPRASTMRLVRFSSRNAFEKESSPRRNRSNRRKRERERENGRKEKGEKERYLIDEVRRTRKKKKKESLRPAQLRIRTSPSILITGHGRKEFVKILNVRAFFRADN